MCLYGLESRLSGFHKYTWYKWYFIDNTCTYVHVIIIIIIIIIIILLLLLLLLLLFLQIDISIYFNKGGLVSESISAVLRTWVLLSILVGLDNVNAMMCKTKEISSSSSRRRRSSRSSSISLASLVQSRMFAVCKGVSSKPMNAWIMRSGCLYM